MASGRSARREAPDSAERLYLDVHRLGNLVSVIIAEAQLIQAEYDPETPAYQSAVAIERAARELEKMIGLSSHNGAGGSREIPILESSGPVPGSSRMR